MWDHTVFHVVPNWRASPEIVAPSKRNCRIAQRIARAPKRALGAHRVILLDEGHDLAGVFAAYPASIKPPDPRRDPGPGRVNHLHHHSSMALCNYPTLRTSHHLVARLSILHHDPLAVRCTCEVETLHPNEQIKPLAPVKRSRTTSGRVRHHLGPWRRRGLKPAHHQETQPLSVTPDQHPSPTPNYEDASVAPEVDDQHPHRRRVPRRHRPLNDQL